MFIEEVYFSQTDKGRYSGFDSKRDKVIPKKKVITKKKDKVLIMNKIKRTKPERVFDKLTPDNVKYTGDRTLKIKTKRKIRYPDFKIIGQNKVIEIFGIYYHDILPVKNGEKTENPKNIIKEYKEIGIDCLVFWEYEIIKTYEKRKKYPNPDLERVLKKTLEFIKF